MRVRSSDVMAFTAILAGAGAGYGLTNLYANGQRSEADEAEFTYVPDSLETASVPTGADDAAIWAGAWSGLTDALGAPDDIASATDSGGDPERERLTVGEVAGQANLPYDVPARSLRAVFGRPSW